MTAERILMGGAPEGFDARIERILQDYVVQQCADFVAVHGEAAGADLFAARLLESLDKLAKRLGGDRHRTLRAAMQWCRARIITATPRAASPSWSAVAIWL